MKCLSCRLEAGFARLVVRLEDDEKVGSLCSSCESKLDRLVETTTDAEAAGDTCDRCSDVGGFALPEMRLSVADGRSDEFSYEYDLDESTPLLCADHLEGLLREERQVDPHDMLEGGI
jgi:hypothetical protein